jgi:hypothetical protein
MKSRSQHSRKAKTLPPCCDPRNQTYGQHRYERWGSDARYGRCYWCGEAVANDDHDSAAPKRRKVSAVAVWPDLWGELPAPVEYAGPVPTKKEVRGAVAQGRRHNE